MLSVVLCTHNPRINYIQRCLAALRNQTVPSHHWEMLVVDNRSDELIDGRIDVSWHPQAKIIREETLGLTAARLRGIREAKGDLLIFVDDDNVLDPDFLEVAQRTMGEKPFLGSWSGQCRPEFETAPPEWTRRYWGNLVIREFDRDVWSNLPRLPESMPCGAGLCVRREVALHYLGLHESGKRPFQFDRNVKSLLSGGDNDLAACACDVEMGVGLISRLRLTHLISHERLTLEYLTRLVEGIQYSGILLDYLRSGQLGTTTSVQRRILTRLRIAFMDHEHAEIARAVERGVYRARTTISSMQKWQDDAKD